MRKGILFFICFFLFLFLNTASGYYQSCYTEYGFFTKDNYDGTCSCINGYHFEKNLLGDLRCVKDKSCSDIYGVGAKDNYDGTCSCRSGYIMGKNYLGETKCIIGSSYCRENYGIMTNYDYSTGGCKCVSGYIMQNDISGNQSCVNGDTVCKNQLGWNSKYNSYTGNCECNLGYTIQDGKCEEKTISAYFYLAGYDEENDEVIVYDFYTEKWFKLELKWKANLYKAENFVEDFIVINMGTDGKLNRGDYFILNNDKKTTDIITTIQYVEEIY